MAIKKRNQYLITGSPPRNVQVLDSEAIVLIVERAKREHRTLGNAAAVTIIESLGEPDNLTTNSTKNGENEQA